MTTPASPITLSVVNPPRVPFPAVSGVPFPRGAVRSLDHFRLETPNGLEVPAQFQLLAPWPDGSVKAALVTNILPAGAPGYVLRYGPGVSRSAYATGLSCEDAAEAITVVTGPLKVRVSKQRFTLLDQVWLDANLDGAYADTERLLSAPADIVMVKDGQEYRASQDAHPNYAVESCGPVRAVLRGTGKLVSTRGTPLIDVILRVTLYAKQEYVMIEPTVVDTRVEDVDSPKGFSASSYELTLPVPLDHATFEFGGDPEPHDGQVTREVTLYQQGQMRYVDGYPIDPFFTFVYTGAGQGEKAPGWVQAGPLAVAVRHFWQQFPKALTVSPPGARVSLHPLQASQAPAATQPKQYVRPTTFYSPREGGAKTYQVLVRFGTGHASDYQAALDDPPRLMAAPSWYGRSGAFGHWLEAGPWSQGYDQYLLDGFYEPSIGKVMDHGGYAVLYGWRDFGDRLRPGWADIIHDVRIPSFYNDTHVGSHMFFIQYLRTQDPRWWDLAEQATRHWMDIDVSHTRRTGYWRCAEDLGPGEGHLIKHEMVDHACRNVHPGHAHLSGLPDYYLLTGDARALEVLQEAAGWWVNATPCFFPVPVQPPHHAEAERDYAWPLFVLNEAYRATGDVRYLRAGAQIVQHLIEWWQIPAKHLVNKKVVGENDWRRGTGWWTMYPKQDNAPDGYNGTNPWMAGALLSSVIQFYEYDRDYQLVDQSLVQRMLLQCMNYVVKYGWNATKGQFMYSEASPDTDGGWNHLLFPLAYLGRMVKQGVDHVEWYDTAPQWLQIAKQAYDDAHIVRYRGTTNLGFYGYELVWPADFWAIMHELEQSGPSVESRDE